MIDDLEGMARRDARREGRKLPHMVALAEHAAGTRCDGHEWPGDTTATVTVETPSTRLYLCDRCADSLWASLTFRRAEKREEAS